MNLPIKERQVASFLLQFKIDLTGRGLVLGGQIIEGVSADNHSVCIVSKDGPILVKISSVEAAHIQDAHFVALLIKDINGINAVSNAEIGETLGVFS